MSKDSAGHDTGHYGMAPQSSAARDAGSFSAVFTGLRAILEPHAQGMVVVHDAPEVFYLDTPHRMANGKPLFFASVQVGKNYVSFYLMPVYVFPELLNELSPALRKHMQGKSCFNFRVEDAGLFSELQTLTERGRARYQAAGYLPA